MKTPIWNKENSRHEIDGIPFDGHFLEWKIEYVPETYLKESEISGNEWRKGGQARIYLNGDCVLNEFCRSVERALMILSGKLHELQCHFELLGVDIKDWKEELKRKKVLYCGIPSTIEYYSHDGEMIITRDDGKDYLPDLYPSLVEKDGTYDTEWGSKDRVHITDKRINWNITPSSY